jgi:hypothetical protein
VAKVAEVTKVAEGKVAAHKSGSAALLIHDSGFAADPSESLCLLRRHPPLKKGDYPLAASPHMEF